MSDVPSRLLAFVVVALATSIYLVWRGPGRGDSAGTVITLSGVVGVLSFTALLVAIVVRARRK